MKMAEQAIYDEDFSINDQWEQVCCQLKNEFGETAFDSWLKPLSVSSFNDGVMNICAPTAFMKNWVIAHYSDKSIKFGNTKTLTLKKFNLLCKMSDRPKIQLWETATLRF